MHVFGPADQTYKGSRTVLVIVLFIGVATILIVQQVLKSAEVNEEYARYIPWLLILPLGLVVAWLVSLQIGIHAEGISYRSLFGAREMRWDAVEKLYYSSLAYRVYLVPAGTYYMFSLRDGSGNRLSFGNRFERPAELGQLLVQRTYPFIYRRLADHFNSGVELDFGAVRVQREKGIARKSFLNWKWLPWEQVADYAMNQGSFFLWPVGRKYVTGIQAGRIPNAFVLLGLLDEVFGRTAPPAESAD